MVLDWFTLFGALSAAGVLFVMFKLCARRNCGR